MAKTGRSSRLLHITQALLFLDAAIWLTFAVAIVARLIPGGPDQALAAGVVAVLMLGNAAALALAGWGLGRGGKLAFVYAIALLAVNIVLSITDQVSRWDWLFLAWEVVLLGLVLAGAKHHLGGKDRISEDADSIQAAAVRRVGWDEEFIAMAASGDDQLLDAGARLTETFGE